MNGEEADNFLAVFEGDSFDEKSFAINVLQTQVVSEVIEKIDACIGKLESDIERHVVRHHKDLLSRASGIDTLESVLSVVQSRTDALLQGLKKIRARIGEPYARLEQRVLHLRRVQSACDFLRRSGRIFALAKKLPPQPAAGVEEAASLPEDQLGKVAQTLGDLAHQFSGLDWRGVHALEREHRRFARWREAAETRATALLADARGIGSSSAAGSVAASGAPHPQLATCLHAVFCLGRLDDCIVDLAGRVRSDLRTRIRSALDMSSLMQKTPFVSGSGQAAYGSGSGGGGGPPGRANLPAGQSAAYSQALWSGLDALNEEAISGAQFLASLRRILAKKRDPNTQRPLSDLLSPAASEAISPAGFADWLSDCLRNSLANAASASAFLKHAFEGEYPRLLKSANDLSTRLAAVDEELPPLGRAHLASFEAAYLSRSLSRLFDPVDAMFSGGQKSLNSEIEIRRIVEAMTSELTFTQVDQDLLLKIAKNVVKTVQFVCRKAEATRVADATASQVLGPPTEGQQTNASLVNMLGHLSQDLRSALLSADLPDTAVSLLDGSLAELRQLMTQTLEPLLGSVRDSLEAILLTMHQERFDQPSQQAQQQQQQQQCSLYMRELQDFVSRVAQLYLASYRQRDFLYTSMQPIACQCIEVFLLLASLVRPLAESGRLRLAADCAQLELALSPLCRKMSDLGQHYRRLRAFRPLLFQSAHHVANNPSIGEALPASLVAHLLFSRAPADMQSPHTAAGWSVSRYVSWLLDHPEESDRLRFIQGTLVAYAKSAQARGVREYAAVYPVLLTLVNAHLNAASSTDEEANVETEVPAGEGL